MELDIRKLDKAPSCIRFSDTDVLTYNLEGRAGNIRICDMSDPNIEGFVIVHLSDIDNLIKALEKAKELWG